MLGYCLRLGFRVSLGLAEVSVGLVTVVLCLA